jgi:Arc/MetJ-type ribon-helix-helix transcriptional regulator
LTAYYMLKLFFTIGPYCRVMTKRVISVRLSDERLRQLDEVCSRLGMNRSQVINAALRLVPEVMSGKAELHYDSERFKRSGQTE